MVLVSHTHRFVFLKTRKTAGTSVEMLLEPLCAAPGHQVSEKNSGSFSRHGIIGARLQAAKPGTLQKLRYGVWRNHMPAQQVRKNLGKRRWARACKIAIVRDPFDRMVSLFHFRHRSSDILSQDFTAIRTAFRRFVTEGDWSDDRDVVMIDDTYVPDETIRFEQLGQDLEAIIDKLALPIDRSGLTRAKGSPTRKHAPIDYFDAPSVETVRQRMAWVFDRFDYPDRPVHEASL